jgi:ribosomal protein S18 acetylase RimI-like enzyme
LAGLHYDDRQFNDFTLTTFQKEFGLLTGTVKLLLFLPFVRTISPGQLLMDGIAVHSDMRGKGIGTRLLQAVFEFARENKFSSVRLEVVDTNPGARRLYERMGFVETKRERVPFLRNIMGFSGVATMVKTLSEGDKQ